MRIVAAALLAIGVLGLVPSAIGAGPKPKPPAFGAPRILYSSDWSGTTQIYAFDPTAKLPLGRLTFGRAPACGQAACGFSAPVPSPDGTKVAFVDGGGCAGGPRSVYVARADGTFRRRVGRSKYSCPVPGPTAVWAPDSRRLALVIDRAVSVVRADGSQVRELGRGSNPSWSSKGLLAVLVGPGQAYQAGELVVVGPRSRRRPLATADDFSWSPDGKWVAYRTPVPGSRTSRLSIIHPDGTGLRSLSNSVSSSSAPTWSADGRFVGFDDSDGVHLVDMGAGTTRVLAGYSGPVLWTPIGHTFAAQGKDRGEYVIDASSGTSRLLTSDSVWSGSWSPDGRALAYLFNSYTTWDSGSDLKIATVGGSVRDLVLSSADHGGYIGEIAWTRPPATTRYRPAVARSVATINADGLVAPWPITRLAADGGRVAYASCGHVFAWTPSTGAVVQAEPQASLSPRCSTPGEYVAFEVYSLAVAGDRVAYAARQGNMGQVWWLNSTTLAPQTASVTLDVAFGAGGCASGGPGELSGSNDLLVFSDWRVQGGCQTPRTTEQHIERVDPGGCAWNTDLALRRPCPVIAASPGPLVPFDVDKGRIIAGGENATVLLDPNGKQLLSIPVSPLAAQLSGSDVVVLRQGELRDYDAATGDLIHAWPLSSVPSGGECGAPHSGQWECHDDARLLLEDAARGLVTYIFDGHVHLLRLADGADAVVAAGTLARFMDAGLVYADGARLHLVPYDQLPLH